MKKTYYLFNPGRLSRTDNTLKFTPVNESGVEQTPRYLPVEQIDSLYVFGSLDANSALYNFLGKQDIAVHFFDYYENYTGSFMPKDQLLAGRMLIAQTQHYLDKKKRLPIARKFIEGASYNMIKNLKYYGNRGKALDDQIDAMDLLREKIPYCQAIPELMGVEGNIRMVYYEAFNTIIADHEMGQRTKRPPQNIVNSLISFGNMLCYAECLRMIHQTQLNPTISYLHEPGERRYSLALDMAEIFKPLLVDRVTFKVLNKKEIQESDFDSKLNRLVLKDKGRMKYLKAYEERLGETIKHRTLNRSVSYKHLIKLECYKLQKHLLQMEEYKPFKMYW
ncbi:MAG: subtype I-B CRISPR-associated endonuclease Cas1 [Bacteroidetes bacterium HGW-Bacteroidetes-4]|jgi:CRISPR-associated protein Cas1|nr:MAG: subtype I-B CRISPR-associated endonuclease Cas1 [Bacteroidetes bacterium HGW-Bacteroidetes-4]